MQDIIQWIDAEGGRYGPLLASLFAMVVGAIFAILLHGLILRALRTAVRRGRSKTGDVLLRSLSRPMLWIMLAMGVGIAQRMAPLSTSLRESWTLIIGLAFPAMVGWLAITAIRAVQQVVELKADTGSNNLENRRKRTRVQIMSHVMVMLIIFLVISMILLNIPGVRNVGVTLMASAGLAGLAVGAAAQPALKNLIAGVQMAFSEPIRIDDVVIISGEWGRIEDIRLTYVVVRIWDDRRLVVPVSKFLEETFENWTRTTSDLLGSVFIYVDPAADVPRIRTHLETVVRSNARWDGRFFNLAVTDIKPDVMELRVLVTAKDAGTAFDLRCDVREALMTFISREMPEALPRQRLVAAIPSCSDARESGIQLAVVNGGKPLAAGQGA